MMMRSSLLIVALLALAAQAVLGSTAATKVCQTAAQTTPPATRGTHSRLAFLPAGGVHSQRLGAHDHHDSRRLGLRTAAHRRAAICLLQMRDRSAVDLEEGDWVRVREDVVWEGINLNGEWAALPAARSSKLTHRGLSPSDVLTRTFIPRNAREGHICMGKVRGGPNVLLC